MSQIMELLGDPTPDDLKVTNIAKGVGSWRILWKFFWVNNVLWKLSLKQLPACRHLY